MKIYQREMRKGTKVAKLHFFIAEYMEEEEMFVIALREEKKGYEIYQKIKSNDRSVHFMTTNRLARRYYQAGKYKDCIRMANCSITLNKEYKFPYFRKALAFKKLGKIKSALTSIEKAIKLDSHFIIARVLRGYLELLLTTKITEAVREACHIAEILKINKTSNLFSGNPGDYLITDIDRSATCKIKWDLIVGKEDDYEKELLEYTTIKETSGIIKCFL